MDKERNIRLCQLFDKIVPGSILLYPILFLVFLIYKILHIRGDGWRKMTSITHRKVTSRYLGTIKNLRLPDSLPKGSEIDHVIEKLHSIFSSQKDFKTAVEWHKWCSSKIDWQYVDFCKMNLSKEPTTLFFIPDKYFPIREDDQDLVHFLENSVLKSIPKTDFKTANNWPYKLEKELTREATRKFKYTDHEEIKIILRRILSSVWINESRPNDFASGFFSNHISPGFNNFFFNFLKHEKSFDLWLQINHISVDGRSATRFFKQLIKNFGQVTPSNELSPKFPLTIHMSKARVFNQEYDEGSISIDLTDFFDLQRNYENKYGKINPVALLAWLISSHPFFKDIKFNIPVDIPESRAGKRTVGFVFIRPDFFRKRYEFPVSFEKYMAFFNSQFEQVRKRKGANFIMVDITLIIHPLILKLFLKSFYRSLVEITGSTCLTFLKGIDTAIPPLTDNIKSGIIFTLPDYPNNSFSNIGVRSISLNSKQIIESLIELFSDKYKNRDN